MKQQYKIITAFLILLSMSVFAQVEAPLDAVEKVAEEEILLEELDVVITEPLQEAAVIEEVDTTLADEGVQEEINEPTAEAITGDFIHKKDTVDLDNLDISENERKLLKAILPTLSKNEQRVVMPTIKKTDKESILKLLLNKAKEL